MPDTTLEWALWLAERGFLIAPLPTGEKKATVKWKDVYTTDADRIRTWFECAPKMNYLVCPGENYGIVDLDVGGDKDGIARFKELEDVHGASPDTFTVETWSGGRHIYYAVPEAVGNSAGKIAVGVDVRGEGGYVVGPGSTVEGIPYKVVDASPVEAAPDWVLTQMTSARARDADVDTPKFDLDLPDNIQRARDLLSKRDPAIEGSGGDEHTYVTFCRVRELGISQDMAMELVMEEGGWNDRCEPPWEHSEIIIKADNAYSFAKDQQGSKGGVIELYQPEDMVDITEIEIPTEEEEEKDLFSQMAEGMLRGGELWKADTYQRYIIPEWLPDKGYAALLAKRGVGKSTLLLDMASCISTDMAWHGWPVLEGYHSIYFCGEHDTVALQLLRAWKEHNLGVDVADNNRFIFFPNAGDLIDDEKTKNWVKFLRQQIGPEGKAVVFVDTWQRATSMGSQNDDVDMQKATHNAERLAKGLGGPVIAAFHPPKADGAIVLGSSIIENNTVAILTLENLESHKRLEVTRMKGRGEGNDMLLNFDIIDFGEEDEHGRAITGQAVTRIGGTSPITGEEDNVPEVSTAETAEEKLDTTREALAKFLIMLKRHIRSKDAKAKADIGKAVVITELIRLKKSVPADRDEFDLELYEAGGRAVFGGSSSSTSAFERMITKCFIEPKHSTIVKVDSDEWEVSFVRKGSPYILETKKVPEVS